MKKIKAILALVLVAALFCMLFAACAKTEETPAPDSGTNSNTNTNNNNTDKTPDAEPDKDAEPVDPEEIEEIVLAYLDVAGNDTTEWDRMEEYINSISEPAIGVRVDLVVGQMGDYGTTVPMLIASGDQLDIINICPVGGAKLGNLWSNNSLKEIGAELAEYAPDAMEIVGGSIAVYQKDGGTYGLPSNRINTSNEYCVMRKDILEACGQLEAAENCSSWSELEAIWAAVHDYCRENNMYVIGGQKAICVTNAIWSGDEFSTGVQIDRMGDTTVLLAADYKTNKIMSWYEMPEQIAAMERAVTWKENGWIYPDTILGDDHVDNLLKQGVIFCNWNHTEVGVEVSRKLSSGYDVVCPMTCPGIVQTGNLSFGVGIGINSDAVEAACKFINLMYTDARISTVFAWGIEGEDYVMVDGEATYPEPKSGFHAQDYMIGNQMLVPAWQGQGADFREIANASNQSAELSPYLGMTIDTSDITTIVAALSAVKDEYAPTLLSGEYTEEKYNAFLDKLYSVGMQDYIDAVQAQLDAFLASK